MKSSSSRLLAAAICVLILMEIGRGNSFENLDFAE